MKRLVTLTRSGGLLDHSFDLQRIFFGDVPVSFLLEVAFRTTFTFVYLLVNLRFIGQRSIGQITVFELALIIALGSAAGDPMFYPDVPLTHGMAVITLIVICHRILVGVGRLSPRVQEFVEGKTERLVVDGILDLEGVGRSLLTREEVFMVLRQKGVEQLGEVRRAFLEMDGEVSVFEFPEAEMKAGLPTTPLHEHEGVQTFAAGGTPPQSAIFACYACGNTARFDQSERFSACARCRETQWVLALDPGSH